jgi:uncharacterized damage-inducible protein DinB
MPEDLDLTSAAVEAWKTIHATTAFLVAGVPDDVWTLAAPGMPSRSIRSIAAHLHNSRRLWIRTLGEERGITVPARVDERRVTKRALGPALEKSNRGMVSLFALGAKNGGRIPMTKRYTWRNLPLDLGHVLAYFSAHEGHHRGQIVMLARQLGHRLPREVIDGMWQFSTRVRERR